LLVLIAMFSTTAFTVFIPMIEFLPNNQGYSAGVIQLFAFLLGFCIAAILPLALDVSVEVTYPLPPAVTSTLCMIASNGAGVILTFTIPEIQKDTSNLFAGWTVVVYMFISSLFFLPFNATSKRLQLEEREIEEKAKQLAVEKRQSIDSLHQGQGQQIITVDGDKEYEPMIEKQHMVDGMNMDMDYHKAHVDEVLSSASHHFHHSEAADKK